MIKGSSSARLSRDRRRRQLLDTAWRIVAQEGAGALTLAGVAARAGVTKPVAYDHFRDVEGLLVALYRDFDVRQTAMLDAALADAEPTTAARARIIADAYVDCVVAQGREMPSVLGALAGSPALAKVVRNYQREFIATCRALLTPNAAEGAASDARFWAMVGAADGLANAAASGEIDAAAAKAELFDTILALVARSRP